MKTSLSLLVVAFALAITPACGSSDPRALTDEGARALGSGKYEDAAKSYEKALVEIGADTNNPEWKRAKLGAMQAHAQTDAKKAVDEFREFAKSNPKLVTEEIVNNIASRLGDADKFTEAGVVLEIGVEFFKDSKLLAKLKDELADKARSSGDSGAADSLSGLGYGK